MAFGCVHLPLTEDANTNFTRNIPVYPHLGLHTNSRPPNSRTTSPKGPGRLSKDESSDKMAMNPEISKTAMQLSVLSALGYVLYVGSYE